MATTNEAKSSTADNSGTSVLGEVLNDAQKLMQQQLKLFRTEVKEDFEQAKLALYPMACGLATMFLGAIVLSLALAQLLAWSIPSLAPWGGYAIVGLVLTATGAGMYFAGKKRLESVNPIPEKTAEAVKENIQWLTQPK